MTVTLPHLTISWRKGDSTDVTVADGVFPAGAGLVIGVSGFRPKPVVLQSGSKAVVVIGAPVWNGRVAAADLAEVVMRADCIDAVARTINGQFIVLVLDKPQARLTVISDRFNGVPLYWADIGDRFLASYLYHDLFSVVRNAAGVRLRPEVMLQFLWLNRVLMDATYDTASRFLMPATILEVDSRGVDARQYWRPDFTKNVDRGVLAAGEEYIKLLRQSVARLTSDQAPRRYGHFLSGGHDSRSVLAAFSSPPACITVAFADNLEVECARRAAKAVGAPHHFIRLPPDHIDRHFDDAVRLCGGMYSFFDALFIGLEKQVSEHADVVLHGHGLDYLFQGMYLPAKWVQLFGRPTFFRTLTGFGDDLVDDYLNKIPFRVKGADIASLFQVDQKSAAMASLRGAVLGVLEDGKDVCQSDFDRWEYLIIHALGRHYSHPNIDSKLTCAEQRTPSFDNDLFNFYLTLPPAQRVEAEMMRYALNTMNPELGRIATGNWGMPAGASPAMKTAWLIGRKALRHLTGNSALRAPALEDRTWPDREIYLREYPSLRALAMEAVTSPELTDTLTMFNWPLVRSRVESWLSGEPGGAAFIMALVTLFRFLQLARPT